VRRHALSIQRQIEICQEQTKEQKRADSSKQIAAIKHKNGMYLEFSGEVGCELATKSLENRTSGIRLLNVREEDQVIKATVYVPEGQESYFLNRVTQYANEKTAKGEPRNKDLIGSIESINVNFHDN
jgi:hypothetical protein